MNLISTTRQSGTVGKPRVWSASLLALVVGFSVTTILAMGAVAVCRSENACGNGLAGPISVAPVWPLMTGLILALINRRRAATRSWAALVRRSSAPAVIAPLLLSAAAAAWLVTLNTLYVVASLMAAAVVAALSLLFIAVLARGAVRSMGCIGWFVLAGIASVAIVMSLELPLWSTWWGSGLRVAMLGLAPGCAGAFLSMISHPVVDGSRPVIRDMGTWAPVLLLVLICGTAWRAFDALSGSSGGG